MESVLVSSGVYKCALLSSCSSIVTLPFAWIKGSVAFPRGFPTRHSHEAFPRGFPTRLSHVTPWCQSILRVKVEEGQGKLLPLEWTETSRGNLKWWHDPGVPLGFRWRAPPLELLWQVREFIPDHAGKGSLFSREEAETGLFWMWAGLSCFLSSGDGYIGELLELQQG